MDQPQPSPAAEGPPDTPALFAPPAHRWNRLSPRLATVNRLSLSLTWGVITTVAVVASWLIAGRLWLSVTLAGVGLLCWGWQWLRARRVVASWGYAERDADLCVTHGLWFRELTVVPFGRMQVVKVSSGPLSRSFGLATVELVTASSATDATIPGLPLEEARALRDRIIEMSDATGSGL
ncbi:MAG: PH domain-containing protein [Propioniciclava sp.]